MKRRLISIFVVLGLFITITRVFAQSQGSTNFQNSQSFFVPADFDTNSSNFQINGSIEMVVGSSESASFSAQSGVPLTVENSGAGSGSGSGSGSSGSGGGGGLSQGTAPDPTLEYHSPTFFSQQLLHGLRSSAADFILVNGSTNEVILVDSLHWQRNLPLFLGRNTVLVQSRQPTGTLSRIIAADIIRLLVGDVNRDHRVDDADLSLFTRAWFQYTPSADFNEDHRIDDQDLSLLASHWGWISVAL